MKKPFVTLVFFSLLLIGLLGGCICQKIRVEGMSTPTEETPFRCLTMGNCDYSTYLVEDSLGKLVWATDLWLNEKPNLVLPPFLAELDPERNIFQAIPWPEELADYKHAIPLSLREIWTNGYVSRWEAEVLDETTQPPVTKKVGFSLFAE